ncbi:MAG: protein kinase, partial [Chloroflexota bacterium]
MTEIGSVLGGRYRLVELLGQGGMATIFRARDAQLDRDVAVKIMRPEFGQDPDFLGRFRDEARAAASLNHPNIVSVFDFGEEDTGPYIVMELIDGQDLSSILRENGPLPPRQAARVSAEVAKALHAAHVRSIVHRDVKPSNILVGRDGRVKVADFGIARALTEAQLTLPGVTMGSVHYFSPEQARGEPATIASDIYSLGIVLYESLTGQRPFSGDGAAAVALARLTSTPPRPSALRPGVPEALDAIVTRAMALDPATRFASAASMASALEGWLAEPAARPTAPVVAGAVAAGTVAAAAARPGQVPYAPDAYARSAPPSAPVSTRSAPPPPPVSDDDAPEPGTPWAWVAGLLGVGILVVVGFL